MKSLLPRAIAWSVLLLFSVAGVKPVQAQVLRTTSFQLTAQPTSGLASNSVTDVLVHGNTIWFGTGKGLSRTRDDGLSFESFGRDQGLGRGGVSGLAVSDEVIWVATGFDSTTDFGTFQTGGGLAYSTDDGQSWHFVPQPGPTPVQNITFDIALRGDEVWITSFGGGLRKSSDLGANWEIVTPDSFIFDPVGRLNHRAFSVLSVDGTLWVGTAGGINRSTDGGVTWTNFNHANQTEPISGNFVVAIARQQFRDREIIWAATRETTVESGDTTEFRGVSFSEDQGFTWQTALNGETVHNFAFDDSVVYAASDRGLFKSLDFGQTWALFPEIVSFDGSRRVLAEEVFDAGVSAGHTLWAGTGDGLARTSDSGLNWEVVQAFERTGREGAPRTYAYPNPFSPNLHNRLNGAGHVRFQYNTTRDTRVSLKIYDFSMQHVRTVVEDVFRPANGDFYEIWDGTDSTGRQVANGVYFYRLQLDGEGTFWGKLIVLN
ncbi:MAG: hypothetical protein D6743_02810 [Calditrichaeota bacterium]|nr:MAG: hypothetical protein D6743_02810 [Calditrichota bacterium]